MVADASTATTADPATNGGPPVTTPSPVAGRGTGRRGDRLLAGGSLGAGLAIIAILSAVGVFLLIKAIPALQANTGSFLTDTAFLPDSDPPRFGIAALAYGTVVSSTIALLLAFPVALGVALFITQYAPRRLSGPLGYLVDLLAAVPSVVYGLWGLVFLNDKIKPLSEWLHSWFGFLPLFGDGPYGRSMLLAGIVLAIMILPIIAAISREVFLQVPSSYREAALALGATRWEMIRLAVLPPSRSGVVGATMLGLGRALGETIAVALVILSSFQIKADVLSSGGNSIAANIATKFGESGITGRGALIASGLVLFVITLVVNLAARAIVARGRLS